MIFFLTAKAAKFFARLTKTLCDLCVVFTLRTLPADGQVCG